MRLLDLITSGLGLVVLSPLFLLTALAIRLDTLGSIFYRAKRIGKDGVPFHLYKFRNMVSNADKQGPGITATGDSRITRGGRFLR